MEHDASMDSFISEIHSRPAIWDLNSDLYSNRIEKVKAWEEICELFINNFKDKSSKEKNAAAATLQRKWKSLRDSFNREIGKQKKSGCGTSSRKEYIYFKQLSFLKRSLHATRNADIPHCRTSPPPPPAQLTVRRSTHRPRTVMEHDASMDSFISEIHSRPAIWDLNSDLYSNRNEKVKAWEEICELFINNFKDKSSKEKYAAAATLHRKWKSLRDSFNREIGKQKKSGSGTSSRKEYMYFKQLSFLKRLNNVRPTTDEEINKNDSGLEQREQNEEESCSSSISRRRATKRNIDKTDNEILKLSDNLKNKYERPDDVDPDKDFLMSVLPDIRKISADFKIDFKGEMLQLIKKYKMLPIHNYRSYSSRSYGYSSQNTSAHTANQAAPSTPLSSPSALSNYSDNSMDDSSTIEDFFGPE